jgi:hypothetical protein
MDNIAQKEALKKTDNSIESIGQILRYSFFVVIRTKGAIRIIRGNCPCCFQSLLHRYCSDGLGAEFRKKPANIPMSYKYLILAIIII